MTGDITRLGEGRGFASTATLRAGLAERCGLLVTGTEGVWLSSLPASKLGCVVVDVALLEVTTGVASSGSLSCASLAELSRSVVFFEADLRTGLTTGVFVAATVLRAIRLLGCGKLEVEASRVLCLLVLGAGLTLTDVVLSSSLAVTTSVAGWDLLLATLLAAGTVLST